MATDTIPSSELTLFTQISEVNTRRISARPDMAVDPTSFALTIRRVRLKDDGYFTCRVFDRTSLSNFYNQTMLQVYSKYL